MNQEEKYMLAALVEADKAAAKGEVPVGCVIVVGGKIMARGHNQREAKNDPTGHAEMVALKKAGKKIGSWRLDGAEAYVTCEPCPMCGGALVLARVKKVVYGCRDPKAGAIDTLYRLGRDGRLNHRFEVQSGVLERECREKLSGFFKKLRTEL